MFLNPLALCGIAGLEFELPSVLRVGGGVGKLELDWLQEFEAMRSAHHQRAEQGLS